MLTRAENMRPSRRVTGYADLEGETIELTRATRIPGLGGLPIGKKLKVGEQIDARGARYLVSIKKAVLLENKSRETATRRTGRETAAVETEAQD